MKLTCDIYIEMISAGIDGELTDSEAAELEGHLNVCESCRARSDIMTVQSQSMKTLPIPVQPSGLRAAIRDRIGLADMARRRAVLHIRRLPDRPDLPAKAQPKPTVPGPLMGPWGRA